MCPERAPTSVSGKRIREFFHEIPATYDWINLLMTGGLDRYWRKKAARLATRQPKRRAMAPETQTPSMAFSGNRTALDVSIPEMRPDGAFMEGSPHRGDMWLDICAGTGQLTMSLARQAKAGTTIIALDFSSPMLALLAPPKATCVIHRCLGDVVALPFPNDAFDLVTVAFATRNLHTSPENLLSCFREIRRVLKPGGRFMNLETSQPANPLIRRAFHGFIGIAVNLIGALVSGSSFPYQYLSSSMKTFYTPEELVDLLSKSGFQDATWLPMTFGSVAAHLAVKR